MEKERITSQKQVILDYLENNKTHPSAEEIYSAVKKKLPRISKGTVYRILGNFAKKDKVQIIDKGGVYYFDGDTSSHAHFICNECSRVFDIFEDVCKNCQLIKKTKTKIGKIESYKISFCGTCKKCQINQD